MDRPAVRARLAAVVGALLVLAACGTGTGDPDPPPSSTASPGARESVVWATTGAVSGVSGGKVHVLGAGVIGEVSWTPDGTKAALVAGDPFGSADVELLVWEPATARTGRVPCAGCDGAGIVGDEVRTVSGTTIRRFALADLTERPAITVTADLVGELGHSSVIAAAPGLTVLEYAEGASAYGGPVSLIGVDDGGADRWHYGRDDHNLPVLIAALRAGAGKLAYVTGTRAGCAQEWFHLTVLDLETGLPAVTPAHPDDGRPIADLWWRGDELFVVVSSNWADCEEGVDPMLHTALVDGEWVDRINEGTRVARTLPDGATVHVNDRFVLLLTEPGGAPVSLATDVRQVWTPSAPRR